MKELRAYLDGMSLFSAWEFINVTRSCVTESTADFSLDMASLAIRSARNFSLSLFSMEDMLAEAAKRASDTERARLKMMIVWSNSENIKFSVGPTVAMLGSGQIFISTSSKSL